MINQNLKMITTVDNQQIAVWKISEDNVLKKKSSASTPPSATSNHFKSLNAPLHTIGSKQYLLFIHGAFSDKGVCLGIANYFAELGYECFIMEWRGHGSSSHPESNYHLEDIASKDVKATFDYLINDLKIDNLHCITHSGGGICLTMFLTQYHEYINNINSITLVACQAFAATNSSLEFAKLLTLKAITRQLGVVKGKALKLGTMDESYYLLSQWMDWNLNQNFKTYTATSIKDQLINQILKLPGKSSKKAEASQTLDYRAQMPRVNIPIFSICAKGDSIAPPYGCLKYLQAFKNSNNKWREFAVANGDLDDYNHTLIFLSRHAAKEVWPAIKQWVEKHS